VEAREAFDEIIGIFEQETLPLIKAGAEMPGPIEEAFVRAHKGACRTRHAQSIGSEPA
jgi:hypothetical protein